LVTAKNVSDLMQGCRVSALGPDRANPDLLFALAWLPVVDLDPVDRAEPPDMPPHLRDGDLTHFPQMFRAPQQPQLVTLQAMLARGAILGAVDMDAATFHGCLIIGLSYWFTMPRSAVSGRRHRQFQRQNSEFH
jgi:hypothetical protein